MKDQLKVIATRMRRYAEELRETKAYCLVDTIAMLAIEAERLGAFNDDRWIILRMYSERNRTCPLWFRLGTILTNVAAEFPDRFPLDPLEGYPTEDEWLEKLPIATEALADALCEISGNQETGTPGRRKNPEWDKKRAEYADKHGIPAAAQEYDQEERTIRQAIERHRDRNSGKE